MVSNLQPCRYCLAHRKFTITIRLTNCQIKYVGICANFNNHLQKLCDFYFEGTACELGNPPPVWLLNYPAPRPKILHRLFYFSLEGCESVSINLRSSSSQEKASAAMLC